jgi:hypothetical protein
MKIQTTPIARLRLKQKSPWLLGYREVTAGPGAVRDMSGVSDHDMFDPGKPLDVALGLVTAGPLIGCVKVVIGTCYPSIFYPSAIEAILLTEKLCARCGAKPVAPASGRYCASCIDSALSPTCRYCGEPVDEEGQVHAGGCGKVG